MMRLTFYFLLLVLIILPISGAAQTSAVDPHAHDRRHEHHGMRMDMEGTVMNENQVRHQWMIHDLPRYLYPEGMFHIEVNGHGKETGTFIVPSAKKTYLV